MERVSFAFKWRHGCCCFVFWGVFCCCFFCGTRLLHLKETEGSALTCLIKNLVIFVTRNHRKICADDDGYPHIGKKCKPHRFFFIFLCQVSASCEPNSSSSVQKNAHVEVEGAWVKARKCACSPAKAPTHTPGQISLMNKEDALWPPVLASHAPQRCSLQYSRQPLSERNYSKGPQRASGLIKWKVGLRVSLLHTARQLTLSLGRLTVACSRYASFPVLRGCKM